MEIPGSLLNIEGATEDKTIVFDISEYLPPGLSVNGNAQVSVTLKVEALNRRSYPFSLSDMEILGENEAFHYRLSPERIILVVSGLKDDLEAREKASLGVTMDVTDLDPGVHAGVLQFVLPDGIALESYTPFSLVITALDEEEPEESREAAAGSTAEASSAGGAASSSTEGRETTATSPSKTLESQPAFPTESRPLPAVERETGNPTETGPPVTRPESSPAVQ